MCILFLFAIDQHVYSLNPITIQWLCQLPLFYPDFAGGYLICLR